MYKIPVQGPALVTPQHSSSQDTAPSQKPRREEGRSGEGEKKLMFPYNCCPLLRWSRLVGRWILGIDSKCFNVFDNNIFAN